jgi:hypothetical protein
MACSGTILPFLLVPEKHGVTEVWRKLHNEEFSNQIKGDETGGACSTHD